MNAMLLVNVTVQMPTRILAHLQAPTTNTLPVGMLESPGQWEDISPQGQFLLDMEFLTRHARPPPQKTRPTAVADIACVYTKCPTYLAEISQQFPWVHFFAFECPLLWNMTGGFANEGGGEYDPTQPGMDMANCPSQQTNHNRTTTPYEFSKDSAVILSKTKEQDPERHRLVMICHGKDSIRQMVLHALIRADFSLLDISGPIPEDYLDGELTLPIMLPRNKMFALLTVNNDCKARRYKPPIYNEEIGDHPPPLPNVSSHKQK